MARQVAMLALLACAVAASRTPSSSESDSFDPFIWDDYEYFENTHRTKPPKLATKVILKGNEPKVNLSENVITTRKPVKSDDKKKHVIKTTNINIATNFVITKRPPVLKTTPKVQQYVVKDSEQYQAHWNPNSSKKPTRKSSSPKRRVTSTRRPPARVKQSTSKTTAAHTKGPECEQKQSSWLSSFFQSTDKPKKVTKKPKEPGWLPDIFSKVFTWMWGDESWSVIGWFEDDKPKKPTTTPSPTVTTTSSWFHSMLAEEGDGFEAGIKKKTTKKLTRKNYRGYRLLRTFPENKAQLQELLDLQEESDGSEVMWWKTPSMNGSTDLLVPPDLLEDIIDQLKSAKIHFETVISNLQNAINYENPRLSKKHRLQLELSRGHPLTWRRYHRYADILRYLEYLQHTYEGLVEIVPIGRSSEGLPLVVVKVSTSTNNTKETVNIKNKKYKLRSRLKPAIWIDAGTHAREWIGPAVATWILKALIEGNSGQGYDYEALKAADFYIMPVLNPDGYEHSHTYDRLWSKTRSRGADDDEDYISWLPWNWGRENCVGVNADRNWDYRWGEQDSSKDPCSDNYAGTHPFSEPETRAVSDFLFEHRGQIKVYISLHAYSQTWMLPSSYGHKSYDKDTDLLELGKIASSAMTDVYGTPYKVGTPAEIHQAASGMSHDWASRAGIKYAYHVELPDSAGQYGFLLPGSQIINTGRETWQAVKTIADNLYTPPS